MLDVSKLSTILNTASALAAGPKPGVTKTEFWLTSAIALWSSVSPSIPQPYGIIISAVSIGVYTLARSIVYAAHAKGKLLDVPELPEAPK